MGDAVREAVVLFRADASHEIGGGHVMRLLALADAHQRRGGRALFAMSRAAEPFHGLLTARGHEVITVAATSGSAGDIDSTRALARQRGAVAVVLDGGFAGLPYERELAGDGTAVIAIDDGAGRTSAADILVNPNAGAQQADYHGERPIRILRGPRFALLRPEFLGGWRRSRRRTLVPYSRVLISFGTSDPAGGTARALRCLPAAPPVHLLVVLGAHHASAGEALDAAERAARAGHAVEVLTEPPNMARVMVSADAAISAAGGTLLELAHLGCPTLAFVVADNQRPGCRALVGAGCAAGGEDLRELGDDDLARLIAGFLRDDGGRRRLADRSRRLVDGLGANRVLSTLEQHLSGPAPGTRPPHDHQDPARAR